MSVEADRARVVRSLDELRNTPLDQIPTEQAAEVVRSILARDSRHVVTVDVARFGSSI